MYAQELLIQPTETAYDTQPKTEVKTNYVNSFPTKPYQELDGALKEIFPEQSEQTQLSRLKKLLGTSVESMSESELKVVLADFQVLIDAWLDMYERRVFGGNTLQDLLKGNNNERF